MNYFRKILDLYTNGKPSEKGKTAFLRWLADEEHASEKEEMLRELWHQSDSSSRKKRVQMLPGKESHIRSSIIWQAAAAVLLIVALSSIYLLFTRQGYNDAMLVEQFVPVAHREYITLPDGSEVHLNSHSVLLYPQKFSNENRTVYLIGEANFKVKEDREKPFVVKLSDMQVIVLGTEFDIHAYPQDSLVSTTLLKGSVKVAYNNMQSETILTPSQQLAVNRHTGQSRITTPDLQMVTAWQRGEIAFMGSTMNQIMEVLERKYPYRFIYNNSFFTDDTYTFRFSEEAPLEEVMKVITNVAGYISYTIDKETCTIDTAQQ